MSAKAAYYVPTCKNVRPFKAVLAARQRYVERVYKLMQPALLAVTGNMSAFGMPDRPS